MSNDSTIAVNCSSKWMSTMKMTYPILLDYQYTGSQFLSTMNSTIVGQDTFSFVLVDSEGRYSVPAPYFVNAHTSLVAVPSPSSETFALQECSSNITVRVPNILLTLHVMFARLEVMTLLTSRGIFS